VSPGLEAFTAETLEIALVCTGRYRAISRLSLAPISRAAGVDSLPLPSHEARRVVAAENAARPGRSVNGNNV